MAPAAVSANSSADDTRRHQPFEFNESVQSLVDASDNLKALPNKYNLGDTNDTRASSCESLPVIDYSALTSSDPHQRSKAVAELAEACADWGFFVVSKSHSFNFFFSNCNIEFEPIIDSNLRPWSC